MRIFCISGCLAVPINPDSRNCTVHSSHVITLQKLKYWQEGSNAQNVIMKINKNKSVKMYPFCFREDTIDFFCVSVMLLSQFASVFQ